MSWNWRGAEWAEFQTKASRPQMKPSNPQPYSPLKMWATSKLLHDHKCWIVVLLSLQKQSKVHFKWIFFFFFFPSRNMHVKWIWWQKITICAFECTIFYFFFPEMKCLHTTTEAGMVSRRRMLHAQQQKRRHGPFLSLPSSDWFFLS